MAELALSVRSRECKNCAQEFTYNVGPGRVRSHCGDACRKSWKVKQRKPRSDWPRCATGGCQTAARSQSDRYCNGCASSLRKASAGLCTVRKCTGAATRSGHRLCEKHYYRVRRTGTVSDRVPVLELMHSGGYVLRKASKHPLAGRNGWAFEHRLVAYDKYAGQQLVCHWCEVSLTWRGAVVDHLDEVKTNNCPRNLVVACNTCNRLRGSMGYMARLLPDAKLNELIASFTLMRARRIAT